MTNPLFGNSMKYLEKQAWQSFKNIVENFLANTRTPDYKDTVHNFLEHFKNLGCTSCILT
jgi:hypothetical protein